MDDLIRKQDAIDAVLELDVSHRVSWKDAVIDTIDVLPSADRPQGEWIGEADGYADGEFVYDTWYCSNCDYVVDDDEPPTWNYCPNCGARMDGAE